MNPQTQAAFDKILSDSANKTCIDCDAFNPQWASVNNGCFMCIKCAGNHRSMGVHISFVRSVTMDGWSKIQLARMKNGGNGKLKKFWEQQNFPKGLTPKQRLDNNAMDKYRENLLELAKGEQVSEIPLIGYKSRELSSNNNLQNAANRSTSNLSNASNSSLSSINSNGSNHRSTKMQGFGNTNYNPHENNKQQNDTWSEFGAWASNFAAKTSAAASDLAHKSKSAAVNMGHKASEKASNVRSKVTDEEFQANLKKNASEAWTNTTKTLSSWWSTAATSVTNAINENMADSQRREMKFYKPDDAEHKQMPHMSSDQYFNANVNDNQNNKNNDVQSEDTQTEEDILGFNEMTIESKKKKSDNIPPPFPKKQTPKKKELHSVDFDDWGFDNDDNENGAKQKEKEKETEDSESQKVEQNKTDSLLDFEANDNQKNKKKNDGNSSDELDAFFDEIVTEENSAAKPKDEKKEQTKSDDNTDDLLTNNNDDKVAADDWGW